MTILAIARVLSFVRLRGAPCTTEIWFDVPTKNGDSSRVLIYTVISDKTIRLVGFCICVLATEQRAKINSDLKYGN